MQWSEEQNGVFAVKGSVLVSASAGSGKTTVVIEKVLRLIKEGTDVRRILLMTFTKAAAAEMREKLVRKMYEQAEESEAIKRQLDNVPFSHIETIHGFCYSLMRKYFNVAKCDPSVAIGDDNAMDEALNECVDKVMEDLFRKGEEDFLMTANFFKTRRSYVGFKEQIVKIIRFASCRKDKDAFYDLCEKGDPAREEEYYLYHTKLTVAYLLSQMKRFLAQCAEEGFADNVPFYRGLRERLEAGLGATTVRDLFPLFTVALKLPSRIGVKAIKDGLCTQELSDLSFAVNAQYNAFCETVRKDAEAYASPDDKQERIKRTLTDVCRAVEREYAAYKKRRKIIDIQDAVALAVEILKDPDARKEIRASFDHVFVDEYQDTDFLQEELIEGLSDGNLFLVGDVKQAIYHFRSSEPEIFLKRGEKYEERPEEGANRSLNRNYRSCEEVLDFTNRVCNRVMIKDFCGIDYENTAQLRYGELVSNTGDEPAVRVYINKDKGERAEVAHGVYSVRDARLAGEDDKESLFVAQEILSFVNGNVRINENGVSRKVRFGDVAVLVRKNKFLRPLFDAFDRANVPYYTQKETNAPFPEREVLVDALRVAFNATDDVSLFNVLSSPIGGFTTADLTEMRAKDHPEIGKNTLWETLTTYKGVPEIEKKAKEFVDFLESLRVRCSFMTAEEALNAVLEKNYDAYLLGKNADSLKKLNAFVSYVGTLAANESPEAFLEYYDTSFTGNTPPAPDDAVAIMTMHGSKGLEFPVVFLPFQDNARTDSRWQLRLEGELGLAVKVYDEDEKTAKESFEARVFEMKNKDAERQELARLMYVAFTRAKNYLVITGREVKTPASVFDGASIMQWIAFAAGSDPVVAQKIREMTLSPVSAGSAQERTKEEKEISLEGLKRIYAYDSARKLPVKYSVSEILKQRDGYGFNPYETTPADDAGATLGTAIHTVMQYVDYGLQTQEEVEESVREMVRQGYLSEREGELVPIRKIFAAIRSPLLQEARKHPCERECPFELYDLPEGGGEDRVLVQGVIDLLIDEGDGYVVVDFKTGGNAEKLRSRYTEQLALYAKGVEKVKKKKVKRRVLYSVLGEFAVEV